MHAASASIHRSTAHRQRLFVVAAKAAFAVVMISGSASLVWVAATAAVPLADFWFLAAPATRTLKRDDAIPLIQCA